MAGIPPVAVYDVGGAITPESPFYLDAGCDVVVHTAFLGWAPAPAVGGGPPRAGLSTSKLLYAFGARVRTAPPPAVVGGVAASSPFTLRLNAAAWSRIITELAAGNVFSGGPIKDHTELQRLVGEAALPNPANLQVSNADLAAGQPFLIPAGAGAAAVNHRRWLEPVRFLHLATVTLLEDPHARCPWEAVTSLVACVGPCLTTASRVVETSHMQEFAALFRARRPELTTDGALARALKNIASDVRLPPELRPDLLTTDAIAEATIDGLNYSSSDRRQGIEERRVTLLVREVRLAAPSLASSQ